MTPASLHSYTAKDLGQMARQAGVAGWHGMRKDELVSALITAGPHPTRQNGSQQNGGNAASKNGFTRSGAVAKGDARPNERSTAPRISAKKRRIQKKLAELNERRQKLHDLSSSRTPTQAASPSDRLVILVRDPYWLHISWELTPQGVGRARTALGQHWHGALPVLRIHRLLEEGATASTKQIVIHGGVSNWYVDVEEPPSRYRAEIGYAANTSNNRVSNDKDLGAFYCIARSNAVLTPAPGSPDEVDQNWADVALNADRVYAMSGGYSHDGVSLELQELLEKRLRRRLGRPSEIRFGNGAAQAQAEQLHFAVDAELVVYGSADPNSHVTIQGEPVALQPDGSFAVKMPFPDRRQVIPLVANSPNGLEQKTIILGVDRNTKQLDQRHRDPVTGR